MSRRTRRTHKLFVQGEGSLRQGIENQIPTTYSANENRCAWRHNPPQRYT